MKYRSFQRENNLSLCCHNKPFLKDASSSAGEDVGCKKKKKKKMNLFCKPHFTVNFLWHIFFLSDLVQKKAQNIEFEKNKDMPTHIIENLERMALKSPDRIGWDQCQ